MFLAVRNGPPPLAIALLALLASGCWGTRTVTDPTLIIQGEEGAELGVSTEFGVVFLGHEVRSGYVEITAFYGDGPSIESTVVEPVGGGIYTAETEIRLPSVPMLFIEPRPGDLLLVRGRRGRNQWNAQLRVRSDPRVYGILLDVPAAIRGHEDQIGAGVYWYPPDDPFDLRLLGLVSGKVLLMTEQGEREYLTVVGPEHLWRLVTHRHDVDRHRPWVYREDVL